MRPMWHSAADLQRTPDPMADPGDFRRHLDRCNNTTLPGGRLPLRLGARPVGYVEPARGGGLLSDLLRRGPDGAVETDPATLQRATSRLAEAGLVAMRGALFDIRATEDGPGLATLDRRALPVFGVAATGVHLNGLVECRGETMLWVARRAADKLLDPGKLDHLAAGGVPAGLTPAETLAKEAAEECGLTASEIATAREVGTIRYAMQRPEGLRRDMLRCYDILLPASWQPVANDGEVEAFELWPLERVFRAVRDTDDFKFNVNLVLIDLFGRRGLLDGTLTDRLESRVA